MGAYGNHKGHKVHEGSKDMRFGMEDTITGEMV
jgi:hypothetical protein